MKIPKKINVCGKVWGIKFDLPVSEQGNNYGSTHLSTQFVYLRPGMNKQTTEETFLHEILHTVWNHAGLNERFRKTPEIEEEIIHSISPTLYQVLKDNFKL